MRLFIEVDSTENDLMQLRSPCKLQRCLYPVIVLFTVMLGALQTTGQAAETLDFKADILPLLNEKCIRCHGPDRQRGGFRIDRMSSLLGEADSGMHPVVPGNIAESELLRRIVTDDEGERMPPEGPQISASDIQTIRQWIESSRGMDNIYGDPVEDKGELVVTDADRNFWAFRPLSEVTIDLESLGLPKNPIDQLLAKHHTDSQSRSPNQQDVADATIPNADPRSVLYRLQRRMYFDVIGLPPDEAAVLAIESNPETFDVDELVEQLLDSPHFGERWGRHWLDVARYADSNGYENDLDRPHAYQYRDFVIRAFNQDLPYDQFVRWQVAGDELNPDNPMAVAATGFLAAGPLNRSAPVAPAEVLQKIRFDELDDIVSTTSQAFLGLTLGCARCHDHKFDPLPTRDYYRFVAAFATSVRRESDLSLPSRTLDLWTTQSKRRLLEEKIAALDCTDDERKWLLVGPMNPAESKKAFKKYGDAISFDDQQWRASLSEADRSILANLESNAKLHRRNEQFAFEPSWAMKKALFVTDQGKTPVQISVLQRGDVSLPADEAPPGVLSVLSRGQQFRDYHSLATRDHELDSTMNRSAVAYWLTDTRHGAGHLLARVIANRIWYHYYGKGIVGTPNDFGLQGDRPSHPELLDWLASELIRNDWKLKSIHRLILRSDAYRRMATNRHARTQNDHSATENKDAAAILNPNSPRRLDSEATRDAILAASGRLNLQMFGPGVRPYVPSSAMATRSRDKWPEGVSETQEHFRRSIYIFVKRSIRFPMMEIFDAPDPTASCGRRIETTVPVQSLSLMNDPSVRAAAKDFAKSLKTQSAPPDLPEQIRSAFRRALGRPPTSAEQKSALDFVQHRPPTDGLTDLCHSLFMCNEFVYVE